MFPSEFIGLKYIISFDKYNNNSFIQDNNFISDIYIISCVNN